MKKSETEWILNPILADEHTFYWVEKRHNNADAILELSDVLLFFFSAFCLCDGVLFFFHSRTLCV